VLIHFPGEMNFVFHWACRARREIIENIRDAIQEYLAAINESIKDTDVREVEIAV